MKEGAQVLEVPPAPQTLSPQFVPGAEAELSSLPSESAQGIS